MPPEAAELVKARAGGRCERCGARDSPYWSLHHRKPRGMGGSKDPRIHSPANLLYLCGSGTTGCHGWVESHRAEARDLGLLLYRNDEPVHIPVQLFSGTHRLLDDGGRQPC